jgi:hypothetical protein
MQPRGELLGPNVCQSTRDLEILAAGQTINENKNYLCAGAGLTAGSVSSAKLAAEWRIRNAKLGPWTHPGKSVRSNGIRVGLEDNRHRFAHGAMGIWIHPDGWRGFTHL